MIRILFALILGGSLGFVSSADDYHHPPTEKEMGAICYGHSFWTDDDRFVEPPNLSKLSAEGQEICRRYNAALEEKYRRIGAERERKAMAAAEEALAETERALKERDMPK